jgi:hypothetical protein
VPHFALRAALGNAAFQQAIAQLAKYAAGKTGADAVIPGACDSVKSIQIARGDRLPGSGYLFGIAQ